MLCMKNASVLKESIELSYYLCPERKISFDGFGHQEMAQLTIEHEYSEENIPIVAEMFSYLQQKKKENI